MSMAVVIQVLKNAVRCEDACRKWSVVGVGGPHIQIPDLLDGNHIRGVIFGFQLVPRQHRRLLNLRTVRMTNPKGADVLPDVLAWIICVVIVATAALMNATDTSRANANQSSLQHGFLP